MENSIIPTKEELHPVTIIMLSYLDNAVGMKKLDEWKEFFNKRQEKNKLASKLYVTASNILQAEPVEEMDFAALMWMVLNFNRTKEEENKIITLEKENRKLRTELRSKNDG